MRTHRDRAHCRGVHGYPLQEVQPALVHFPIAFLPLAVGADLLGRITGSEPLLAMGRHVIPLAAGAAAGAAAFGLVAQKEVKVEGPTHDMLVTHRNLNLGLVAAGTAAWRLKNDRPTATYLALGIAGIGVMSYTAYLGGHMVYDRGVGVGPAGGLREGGPPEVTPARTGEVARTALSDLRRGAAHAVEHIRQGESLRPSRRVRATRLAARGALHVRSRCTRAGGATASARPSRTSFEESPPGRHALLR